MTATREIRQTPEHHLRILHSELLKRGIESDVITSGYKPRLRLNISFDCLNPSPDISFEDNVIVAKGADSRWSFWWPWIEEICGEAVLGDAGFEAAWERGLRASDLDVALDEPVSAGEMAGPVPDAESGGDQSAPAAPAGRTSAPLTVRALGAAVVDVGGV